MSEPEIEMKVCQPVNEGDLYDFYRRNNICEEGYGKDLSEVRGHHLPLRRPGRPEEIAGVAWFLAGPDASYIDGQVITVDGGLTITF